MIEDIIKGIVENEIRTNLNISTCWVGDPSTSTFGINIMLEYRGVPISISTVDFIGKTFD